MGDKNRTKAELIKELAELRHRVAALEQTEEALRQSEQRFRLVADFTYDWEYWIAPGGDYLYVSPSCERITGYCAEEFLQNSGLLKTIVHPDDRDLVAGHLAAELTAHQALALDFRITARNGEVRWIGHVCQPVYGDDGRWLGRRASNRDVTALRQAEAEQAHFTNRLRTAADVSTQLAAILDIEQLLYNVVMLLQSRFSLYHVHVYLLNEAGDDLVMRVGSGEIGRLLRERGHHIPLSREQSLVARAARTRRLVAVDDVRQESNFLPNPLLPETQSEVAIPLIAAEQVLGVLDVQDNTTHRFTASDLDVFSTLAGQIAIAIHNAYLFAEQKRTEQALRETKDQLEAILHGIADGINVIDASGRLIYVNEAAARAAGYPSAQEMVGRPASEIFNKFEILSEGGQPFPFEYLPSQLALAGARSPVANLRFRSRATGQERWSVVKAAPILDERGRVKFAVTITHDITERKHAEEALHRYASRLETLHKIDRDILSAQLPETIALVALRHIRQMIPWARASVVAFDLAANQARILASHPSHHRLAAGKTLPAGAFNLDILAQGLTHRVNDIRSPAAPSVWEQMMLEQGIRAYISVPLMVKDELIGAINVGSGQPGNFKLDHLDIVEEVAASLAIAIQHARLYEQARQDAETKAILLSEVNHRVKNNLATIVGLLYIEQRHAGVERQSPCRALVADLITRIEGLSIVHHMLSASEWAPVPLDELARQIIESVLHALPSDRRVLTTVQSTHDICVSPKQANSLGMVINELATNTVKYVVPKRQTVSITVRVAEEAGGTILFEYRDNGPGLPDDVLQQTRQNVGMYLIHNIVHRDLQGSVALRNEGGAVITVRFKAMGSEAQ